MNINIIGTGYVGLVTGACLADLGNHVFCLDVDQAKIDLLNGGGVPIYEPGLKEIIERNVDAGRLTFSTDIQSSVAHASVQFIAVGTPPDEDGSADLQYVLAAARNIGRHMTDDKVVVDKSTVPVGTADKVSAAINQELAARAATPITFSVVSNPEFLKEGAAVEDFTRPDRNHERTRVMDVKSAEFTKYAANDMRDAPSRVIVQALLRAGARVHAHDPVAAEEARRVLALDLADAPALLQNLQFATKPMQAVQGADALIIATEWKAYRSPNWTALKAAMKAPIIFDGRNLYEPQEMKDNGVQYVAIGRGNHG